MWELDCEESWATKNWCFWTVVLEKTLENPLDCKEIKPVNPKGNQPWIFTGRTDAEVEAPILWPPDVKNWLIRKDPDAGKDWRQVERGTSEDEMVGWHHWLNGRESEWTPGVGDGQGGLVCCDSWGHKESDTTEQLNWTEQDSCNTVNLCNRECRAFMNQTPEPAIHKLCGAGRCSWWHDSAEFDVGLCGQYNAAQIYKE